MSDLVPVDKLRDWVDHCQKGHDTFVEKVRPQQHTPDHPACSCLVNCVFFVAASKTITPWSEGLRTLVGQISQQHGTQQTWLALAKFWQVLAASAGLAI